MKTFYKSVLSLFLLGFVAGPSWAQLNYPVASAQNIAGTYTDLGTTGTVISTSDFDNSNSAAEDIGFTFSFNGQSFTQFVLNTNGFIKLGATPPSTPSLFSAQQTLGTTAIRSTNVADVNLICILNTDLEGGTGPEYRVATTGTAPNRVTTIQYKNVSDKSGGVVAKQFSSMNFQIKLYETTNQIELVYGTFTPTATGADNFILTEGGIKGSSSLAGNSIFATKGSLQTWNLASWLTDPANTGNRLNIRKVAPPDAGRTFRFSPALANDLFVNAVYTLGRVPLVANPIRIQARVTNVGTANATAAKVYLNVTGANSFIDSVTINLNALQSTTVTFGVFSPTNLGFNNITVTVPTDDNPANNTATFVQQVNSTGFMTHADTGAATGTFGVGFPATYSNVFASRFTASSPTQINNVRYFVPNLPSAVGQGAVGVVLNANQVAIAVSAPFTVGASDLGTWKTIPLLAPVIVLSGNYFVGLDYDPTLGDVNLMPLAIQPETPTRDSIFTQTPNTGGAIGGGGQFNPVFAGYGGNIIRFMLGADIASGSGLSDVAVNQVFTFGKVSNLFSNPVQVRARVQNAGTVAINNLVVRLNVTGANSSVDSTVVSTLNVGDTATVTFNSFSVNNLGVNSINVSVPNDDNNGNNSAIVNQTVTPDTVNYSLTNGTGSSSFGAGAANNGVFMVRYPVTDSSVISMVNVRIANNAASVGNTVFAVVKTAGGLTIGQSAPRVIATGDIGTYVSFPITYQVTPIPVAAPGQSLFAGLVVTPAVDQAVPYFPMSAESENPVRPGSPYHFTTVYSPSTLPPANTQGFRFMIEAVFVDPNAPNRIGNFSLTSPSNSATLNLTGPASNTFNFAWTTAIDSAGGSVAYTHLLDLDDQSLTKGFAILNSISNGGGTLPNFTTTYGDLDARFDILGIPNGTPFTYYWTAVASSGVNDRYASDTFEITITRGTLQYALCVPSNTDNSNDYIDTFALNGVGQTILNGSGRNTPTQYIDYTNTQGVRLNAGASYPYTATMAFVPKNAQGAYPAGYPYPHQAIAYIDWDKNNFFSSTSEAYPSNVQFADTTLLRGAKVNGTINVPSGQAVDIYRMRVIGGDTSGTLLPCNVQYGDVEDYGIAVGMPWMPQGIATVQFQNNMFVYPNPASGMVYIGYDFDGVKNVTATLYNAIGAVVNAEQYSQVKSGTKGMDISKITPGVYILKLTTDDGTSTVKRLVIE